MKRTADLLAENIAALREERGWTQAKLAENAGIGLEVVQRAESKTVFPRQAKLTAIANALGVPEARLFYDIEGSKPTPSEALNVLKSALFDPSAAVDRRLSGIIDRLTKASPGTLESVEEVLGGAEQARPPAQVPTKVAK